MLGLLALWFTLHAFTLHREDYWFDELFTLNVARLPGFSAIWERLKTDTSPPLFFWILHCWPAGGPENGAPERWLPAAAGALGILALFLWMRRGFGTPTALMASLLLSGNTFWIVYSQELRMYTLYPAMLWWAALFLQRAVEGGDRRDWAAFAACGALALWMHYHAAFFLTAAAGATALFAWRHKTAEGPILHGLKFSLLLLILLSVPLAALIPHQIVNSLGNISWLQTPKLRHLITNFTVDFSVYQFGSFPVWRHLTRMGVIGFYALLGAGMLLEWGRYLMRTSGRRDGHNVSAPFSVWLLAATAFVPPVAMILCSFSPVKFWTPGRYAILSLGPFMGVMALAISRWCPPGGWRGLLVGILMGVNAMSGCQILVERNKPEWRQLAAAVQMDVPPDVPLVGFPDYWFNGFRYYLGYDVPVLNFFDFVLQDRPTPQVCALVFNLAAPEDEFYPWGVLRFMELNSEKRILHWDPWHTLMRLDHLDHRMLKDWWVLRRQWGRRDVLSKNPVWFVGAEELKRLLGPRHFGGAEIRASGEMAGWLSDPPIQLPLPAGLGPGRYRVAMKAAFEFKGHPPPGSMTLSLNEKLLKTFEIESDGEFILEAPLELPPDAPPPTLQLDGETFRPVDIDPALGDTRRLFMEFFWLAVLKD
ncbi:MAG: hypothetical protein Kow0059_21830 [Candidatus Sumerlaeia bacterium]